MFFWEVPIVVELQSVQRRWQRVMSPDRPPGLSEPSLADRETWRKARDTRCRTQVAPAKDGFGLWRLGTDVDAVGGTAQEH